jgi:hypothetical protein
VLEQLLGVMFKTPYTGTIWLMLLVNVVLAMFTYWYDSVTFVLMLDGVKEKVPFTVEVPDV